MASCESGLRFNILRYFLLNSFTSFAKRIVMLVDDTFFERNNRIIRDGYVLRANLCTAFCDVAVADAEKVFQLLGPVFGIERMHFERSRINQKSRADKFVMLFMIAKHVTNVLAQKALDALAKFLDAVDVRLLHPPRSVRGVGRHAV